MVSDEYGRTPRRPLHVTPDVLESRLGATPDPAETTAAAHATAAVLVGSGRASTDPGTTERLVSLVDELGLDTVADLWAGRPARSLPGALWRLYALREWVRRNPVTASREYTAGVRFTDVNHVVAGVAEPPGPDGLRELADRILAGVFDGDLAVALERAAAFCRVLSAGRADLASETDVSDPEESTARTRRAASMLSTADDLEACAGLWRSDALT